MKKLLSSVVMFGLLSIPAWAGTCPADVDPMTTCPDYTLNAGFYNLNPVYGTYGGVTILTSTVGALHTAGLDELTQGGTVVDTNSIPFATWKAAQSLNTRVSSLESNSGVTAGSYTNASITVNANGKVTAASNGTGAGSATFNYPSRTLNSCFQISSSKDADFHYKVDISTGLSLTTGAQGTVTATSYTNSGCTTGAQAITDGTSSQTGTLVVGLALNQTVSVGIDGTLPSGKWLKITTANTVGTPTFSIRAVQAEKIQP